MFSGRYEYALDDKGRLSIPSKFREILASHHEPEKKRIEGHYGAERAQVESRLTALPGPQLAIVRYRPDHQVLDEWVYNHPDIDASKVVWARELDAADNKALIDHYRDRTAWLVEPDSSPAAVSPYPVQVDSSAGAR